MALYKSPLCKGSHELIQWVSLRRPDYLGKIDGRLPKLRDPTVTAKCDLEKFKQPAVTFCLLVKIVRPRQCIRREKARIVPKKGILTNIQPPGRITIRLSCPHGFDNVGRLTAFSQA